ncbi:hypothetical protein [Salinithrix halophila]|uniref:Uncharacterized protein n=1 Tax=Salinithrix halophila TaxID=1485204 RepID=A0ABV8JED8_9BACL
MNAKAAVFACRFTGAVGILASFLMWKIHGPVGFTLGLIFSLFWFALAWYYQR